MPLCRPDTATACQGRYDGVRAGVIWYSQTARRWLVLDWEGVPRFTDRCPWCLGALPRLQDVVQRIIETPDVDRYREAQGDGDAEDAD